MPEHFHLRFGALVPRIEEQLQEQGLWIGLEPLSRQLLQIDADEVFRLRSRGILSEAEAGRARRRLLKVIGKHLQPIEPAAGEVQP
jgi:hypothetical protein